MLSVMTAPRRKWYRVQFSLRTLLITVSVLAIPCSWLAVKMKEARRVATVVSEIEQCGGNVSCSATCVPKYIRSYFGEYVFVTITSVRFESSGEHLPTDRISLLNSLNCRYPFQLSLRKITDWDLESLVGLQNSFNLDLSYSNVTDSQLIHLKRLQRTQVLLLDSTQVTDAGLEHLKDMRQLQSLGLCETNVTDAGLCNLKVLSELRYVALPGDSVTERGANTLRKELPNCMIERVFPVGWGG